MEFFQDLLCLKKKMFSLWKIFSDGGQAGVGRVFNKRGGKRQILRKVTCGTFTKIFLKFFGKAAVMRVSGFQCDLGYS